MQYIQGLQVYQFQIRQESAKNLIGCNSSTAKTRFLASTISEQSISWNKCENLAFSSASLCH